MSILEKTIWPAPKRATSDPEKLNRSAPKGDKCYRKAKLVSPKGAAAFSRGRLPAEALAKAGKPPESGCVYN
jgi:hypothetical protein